MPIQVSIYLNQAKDTATEVLILESRLLMYIQWKLSITVTPWDHMWSVLIKEVSLFQRLFCTFLYVAGTICSVLIREVSLFRRFLIERFHCMCALQRVELHAQVGSSSRVVYQVKGLLDGNCVYVWPHSTVDMVLGMRGWITPMGDICCFH